MKRTAQEIAQQAAERADELAQGYSDPRLRQTFRIAFLMGARAMAIDVGRPIDGPLARELQRRINQILGEIEATAS